MSIFLMTTLYIPLLSVSANELPARSTINIHANYFSITEDNLFLDDTLYNASDFISDSVIQVLAQEKLSLKPGEFSTELYMVKNVWGFEDDFTRFLRLKWWKKRKFRNRLVFEIQEKVEDLYPASHTVVTPKRKFIIVDAFTGKIVHRGIHRKETDYF